MSFDEAVSKIENEVEESVKYHKISDVEVGSFLSGGVDLKLCCCNSNA